MIHAILCTKVNIANTSEVAGENQSEILNLLQAQSK